MKKEPDIVLILVVAFVVGSVMTGVSHVDFQFATVVQQVFSNS